MPPPASRESAAAVLPNASSAPRGSGPSGARRDDPVRAMPASEEAEKAALCCMILDQEECLQGQMGRLPPAAFHSPSNRVVYEAMCEVMNEKARFDLVTLTEALNKEGKLAEAGGPAYLAELSDFVPTTALFESYVETLREKHVLREIIATCNTCTTQAFDSGSSVEAVLDEVEEKILGIRDEGQGGSGGELKDHVFEAISAFDKMLKNRGAISGLSTGFKDLDKMTDGFHGGEMIVIAARPSMGKTSLVMNIVERVALDDGKSALVFSLEMSSNQLVQRLLCARARVSMSKFRDGFASKADFKKVMQVGKELSEARLFIDDTPSISVMEMRAKARRVHHRQPLGLIAIDYLQLMKSTSKKAADNRQIEISEISAGIKALAKELSVPVVVLAQLNRNPEKRESKKPMLSDLRESGSIEQDADVVGLLVREDYYHREDDGEGAERGANKAELIVAKQRNGPTGDVPLVFLKDLMRFGDRARDDMEEPN